MCKEAYKCHINKCLVFVLVLILNIVINLPINSSSLFEDIVIKDYSYADGLTTNCVNNTYRDSRGFLWICSANGLYRYDGYHFEKIKGTDNLLQAEILCIAEDEKKNLWVGTAKNGLIYYNTLTEEAKQVSVSENNLMNINRILIFKNKIWLGTDKGLLFFDVPDEVNDFQKINVKQIVPEPTNLVDQRNKITYFFVTPDSTNIWLGTNGGMYVLNIHNFLLKGIATHPQNSVRIIVPFEGNVLAGSWDGGVFLVNSKTLTKIVNHSKINWINKILERKRVISATFDGNNHLWIATFGDGIYCFNLEDEKYEYLSCRQNEDNVPKIKSDIVNHIYYDGFSNIMWLSMNQPALTKIYFEKNDFQTIQLEKLLKGQPIEITYVTYSSLFPNSVWVGTSHNGLMLYNIVNKTIQNFSSSSSFIKLPSNEVSKLHEDRHGNLWIVFRKIGLFVIPANMLKNIQSKNSKIFPIDANLLVENFFVNSYIMSFYDDSHGRLWIGHWGSLHVVNFLPEFVNSKNTDDVLKNGKSICIFKDAMPIKVSFPISPVQAIIEITPKKYFIGTRDEGIIEVVEKSFNHFVAQPAYQLNKNLTGKNIQSFYISPFNELWIGTNTGLNYYNITDNKFEFYTEQNGLSSDNINHITADNSGNIWLSTSYGISQITAKSRSIRNYLFSSYKNQFNFYINNASAKLTNGIICFSTNKSLVVFNPDLIKSQHVVVPFYFTNIKINDQTISPLQKVNAAQIIRNNVNAVTEIYIPYNTTLQLEFAALDYRYAEQIKYKYHINSNSWVLLHRNQRSISFYNQNPGEYQLHLMAVHPSGSYSVRNVNLIFLPPWWKTWWAYTIYISIFLLLFFSYRKIIIQNIRQKVKLEQEQFERIKIQELDRVKTNFVTNLAHELRTPLCLIVNPIETVIKNQKLDSLTKEKLEITLQNSYRLIKLANELSDFARLEKELIQPEFKNYDIVSEVKQIYKLFTSIADSMNIDYQFHSAFDSMVIKLDKSMFEKIIFNLLSNAFKYTSHDGSVIVELTQAVVDNNSYVRFSVLNTGEGIPENKIDKIFERFYQIDQSKQGLGIGLSIVKSLVEMHQGLIKVRSIPHIETCFEVLLPLTTVKESSTNVLISDFGITTENSASLQEKSTVDKNKTNHKLLIIEDDNDILKYLVSEFSPHYKVYTADNGETGFRICQKIIPDVVITDVVMPVKNGIDLCKQIRNDMTTSHIPIIVLSARSSTDQQIDGLNAGANIYMVKPFNIQILKNQVEKLVLLKESIYQKFFKDFDINPFNDLSNNLDKQFIEKVIKYIEDNITNPNLSVDDLSSYICLSKVQLYRKIKAITGLSVIEFINSLRLKKAAKLILERKYSFSEIAYETGFSSPSYFTKCFREHFGKTPSEYLESYSKQEI